MAYTTDAAIREMLDVDTDLTDLSWAITIANELVVEICVPAGYTDTRLERIECCLAAHFACLKDIRTKSEKAGAVGATYDTKLDLYFCNTHHGQAALVLDTAGGLAALMEEIKSGGAAPVGIDWMGTEEGVTYD